MSGNKFGVGGYVPNERADVIYQALNAASAFKIDERKTSGEEIIAEVHHIRFHEKHDRIPVGVPVWVMYGPHLFAVEVDR